MPTIVAGVLGQTSMLDAARRLALNGPASLPRGVPVETVGSWSSLDRSEIEELRSAGLVIEEYTTKYFSAQPLGRPLSIAVFGAPGSGKSFAVKQIISHALSGAARILEFNLSQFDDASELTAAFHQIRDAVLEQRLPLVFWDEFDTPLNERRLGWLRHFLAPMQDGKFREGEAFRPLGPAIFIFAGGTASSFNEFAAVRDAEAEVVAKKPDFISRLRGYVDVLGPNPKSPQDDAVVLRRALLLRSLLLRKAPQIVSDSDPGPALRIDPGLLRAFLLASRYKHGARSMEALIEMSALSGRMQYEQASLPAPHLLDLHVDAAEFLALATRAENVDTIRG
ncbi:MAG: AAA family ATPase [Thermoleophilia bacterium]